MLISCPKCHSIYEIPDDLIKKTGQNFRCQACSNVWHAMREDALGYEEDKEDLYIEPLTVSTPPYRNYPANKEHYTIPADTKSGTRTRSSKEVIAKEGIPDYVPPKSKKKKEYTLTSDQGTSFTISAAPEYAETEDIKTPYLSDQETIYINEDDRFSVPQSAPSSFLRRLFVFLLILISLSIFLRRDIVNFYPPAEIWYNKAYLSGLHNEEYLKFENIIVAEQIIDNQSQLKITADIRNTSRYKTRIPDITLSTEQKSFKAKDDFLEAYGTSKIEIVVPAPKENAPLNLTLGFSRP